MPADFQKAHSASQARNIFTRPDILARESDILQSGIRSLEKQYSAAIDHFHDIIEHNIASLRDVAQASQEYIFPQREAIVSLADTYESELNSGKYVRVEDIRKLSIMSDDATKKAQTEFDLTKRVLILEDTLALKHEMAFLDSYYRFVRWNKLTYDYKALKKGFVQTFTRDALKTIPTEQLLTTLQTFSATLDPYRVESKKMRAEAKVKRAPLVEKEMKKWTDTLPPMAPIGDVYSQIFVSLKLQMMYVYEDGELILSTPVTTGRSTHQTIRGLFHIYTKELDHLMKSPFPEEDYELWVDYWLPFSGAYGIHDSCNSKNCWRTRFGWKDYVYGGSHGCINTPHAAVKFIYGWSRVGTTVFVQ